MMARMNLNREEKLSTRRIIKDKTGYVIKSNLILNQIFRRSSFAAETGQHSNEIFEYIGDQVISFYVVKIVSRKCGSLSPMDDYTFRINENRFTQIKQAFVSNETLAKTISEWDITKYLLLSKSEIKNEVANEPKIKADLLEAIIGAIAIDCNWNPEILEYAVLNVLKIDEKLESIIEDETKTLCFDIDNSVTVLKEMVESNQCKTPKYEFYGPEYMGYDDDGNPNWACSCVTSNNETTFNKVVFASSKKDAKKAAAYLILCAYWGVQNKYGPNSDYSHIWIYKNGKLIPENRVENFTM